jgi:polysaccharide biosynthesis/export protein
MNTPPLLNRQTAALGLALLGLGGQLFDQARADNSSRTISPGDTVQVTVYQDSRLDSTQHVSTDGTISMLYIGQVSLNGTTTQEAAKKISDLLYKEKYIRNAEVQVSVDSYVKENVTVKGQVTHPGPVLLRSEHPMDLLEAIASAGGETSTGDLGHVEVRRSSDGKSTTMKIDVNKLGKENKIFLVQPGDVITVGQNLF